MATITFLGAVEGVTGSCYLLQTDGVTILLECGLFQGRKDEEKTNLDFFSFNVREIDAVVLSHAHLDHSGRLPKLLMQGLNCPIYMTLPTLDLVEVLLKDSASLQEKDAEWENKRRRRAGQEEIQPLYTAEDVEETMRLCEGIDYHHRLNIADGIDINFRDAGHILGSAIVEIFISQGNKEKKLVFSGDLGNSCAALLRDPEVVESADVLLLESTYGDRNHRSMEETLIQFEEIIDVASENGGNILIPSFAVGRTQEIIFRLGEFYQKGKIRNQLVYLDSPMAIAVTEIYHRYQRVFNKTDANTLKKGTNNTQKTLHNLLPNLRYSLTTEDSMSLNKIESGVIIIAGSGMCNGGRIRHHLKHNLWRKRSHVIFVGYQAQGTPGRDLVDGSKKYRIGGDEITVKASIHTLGGFSAHASQTQLLDWLNGFTGKKPRLYLVHGEANAKNTFKQVAESAGWVTEIPSLNQTITF